MPPKKKTRRVLKVNETGLLKHLRVLANHGLTEQGSMEAIRIGRECFYYKKGNERTELSDEEVGKLIFN